jgi:hypothetical protein
MNLLFSANHFFHGIGIGVSRLKSGYSTVFLLFAELIQAIAKSIKNDDFDTLGIQE